MEKSNKRGKIPQSDWPQIMARYEAGETLSSIAKTYDCSPPAISYIVSRSRAKGTNGVASVAVTEPRLVKTHPQSPAEAPIAPVSPVVPAAAQYDAAAASAPLLGQNDAPPRHDQLFAGRGSNSNDAGLAGNTNGVGLAARNLADQDTRHGESGFAGLPPAAPTGPRPSAPQQASDERHTLHLDLGNGSANSSRSASTAESRSAHGNGAGAVISEASRDTRHSSPAPAMPQYAGDELHQPRAATPLRVHDQPGYGYGRPDPYYRSGNGDAGKTDSSGSYIDKDLRARVDTDIAAFLSAFDAALAQDSQDSRSALREATDRLLRAGARTRIELERLEARVPLPPRDAPTRAEPAWRPR